MFLQLTNSNAISAKKYFFALYNNCICEILKRKILTDKKCDFSGSVLLQLQSRGGLVGKVLTRPLFDAMYLQVIVPYPLYLARYTEKIDLSC